jgi:spore coat protein U-like protein
MTSGANQLPYQLRRDSQSGAIWGDGTGGSSKVSDSYTLTLIFSKTTHYSVYGRIPASQNVPPGSYTDTVTARVDF